MAVGGAAAVELAEQVRDAVDKGAVLHAGGQFWMAPDSTCSRPC
ncbi:hypothetical protein [Specibacter cremeus]